MRIASTLFLVALVAAIGLSGPLARSLVAWPAGDAGRVAQSYEAGRGDPLELRKGGVKRCQRAVSGWIKCATDNGWLPPVAQTALHGETGLEWDTGASTPPGRAASTIFRPPRLA